ncbi:MAG TPA: hypothetical protein VFK06_12445 [Candidatus Angelobacter sp.]|nr:hypothetical protein [Candidatus Angelobacter sp.]
MQGPIGWKQHVATAVPLIVSAGIIAGGSIAAAAAATAHGGSFVGDMMASLAPNLIAGGIGALCKPRRFLAGSEQEQLANHDIRRLIDESWSEAAAATVKRYLEIQSAASATHPLGLVYARPPAEFLKVLKDLEVSDFSPKSTVASIRTAIAAARRSLLSDSEQQIGQAQIDSLDSDLAASVVESLAGKYSEPPQDFIDFLAGKDARFPGGVLNQLCIYVALHLKNDNRAQIAVTHFTLQDISDSQARIQELCDSIYEQNQSQLQQLEAFEKRSHDLSNSIQKQIEHALNNFVKPGLRAPFSTAGVDTLQYRFTYGARKTPMVGREAAMQALVDFLSAPGDRLWTVISGPAGSGKSRLAAELIAMTTKGSADHVPIGEWRAGFLERPGWLVDEGLKWEPDADTLIVIDYAGSLDAEILARFLASPRMLRVTQSCVVRIVLIDRMPPDSDLGLVKKLIESRSTLGDVGATRWLPTGARILKPEPLGGHYSSYSAIRESQTAFADALALGPVLERDAITIARAWAGNERWTQQVEKRLREAMQSDPELSRPLFAALLGHAIGEDMLLPGELNPVTVGITALAHQFRSIEGPNDAFEHAKDLFAAATAGQGISEHDLIKHAEAILGEKLSAGVIREVLKSLRRLNGTAPGGIIPPLEPDFLGGLFVLQRILQSGAFMGPKASGIAAIAWKVGRPAAFLGRLAADFFGRAGQVADAITAITKDGDHPTGKNVKEVMLGLLISAVEPDALANNGQLVLVIAIQYACKADDMDSTRQMLNTLSDITKDGNVAARAAFAASLHEVALSLAEFSLAGFMRLDEYENFIKELRLLYYKYPTDAVVRKEFANVLYIGIAVLGLAEEVRFDLSRKIIDELRVLRDKYLDDAPVREMFAKALFLAIILGFSQTEQVNESMKLIDELRVLSDRYPDDTAVRKEFAKTLVDSAIYLAQTGRFDECGIVIEELRVLGDTYQDDTTMRGKFSHALCANTCYLAKARLFDKSNKLIEYLYSLSGKYSYDDVVCESLIRALCVTALYYMADKQFFVSLTLIDKSLELWRKSQPPGACSMLKKIFEWLPLYLKEGPYSQRAQQFAEEAKLMPC